MTDSNPVPLYFCCGEDCEGRPERASEETHPIECLVPGQAWMMLALDDNRPPPPSPLASILRILDAARELVDTAEAAE
jgi:hypothetical protein